MKRLPAYNIAPEVNKLLSKGNKLIVTAAPGAGKSTLLPLSILDCLPPTEKILMLEPRRIAAKQVAERMAEILHEKVGETIGYRIRFESKVSHKTKIEVLTEGILTRMLVNDPTLENVAAVIFDEFHERSLASDVALALTRESQHLVRPDLKIVLMSATIDASTLSKAIGAPIVSSEGKMFPVETIHTQVEATAENAPAAVAQTILKAYKKHEGDILAFLPGQAEILRCQEMLKEALPEAEVMPLYGQLAPQEQRRAILPSCSSLRKVVLATSIAETSLTIEGVRIVVDSGLCRELEFDPRNGLSHLVTNRISLDRATQRTGRAGRTSEGVCYRLWSMATEHRMETCRRPEITTADLSQTILEIAAWGEGNAEQLPWITPPPASGVAQAKRLLASLCAIDGKSKITPLGRTMAEMPCHPRISRMLANKETAETKALATDIAALIEENDIIPERNDADINTRIALLRDARKSGKWGKWGRTVRIAQEYRKQVRTEEINDAFDTDEVGRLLASAYPERVAKAIDNCGRFRLSSGETAFIDKGDELSACDWISVASVNGTNGRIFLASPVTPDRIGDLHSTKRTLAWDNKAGRIIASEETRIGCLVVNTHPIKEVPSSEIIRTICEACPKHGLSMFDFSDDAATLQRRIECVATWHPDLDLPNLSAEAVLQRAEEWLPLFLENGQRLDVGNELKRIDMCKVIWSLLDYGQQQTIDRLAPSHFTVPTGSRIKADYRFGAEVPIVSVRLQECFGMTDTPLVDDGKRAVLMELLSPGFKPVQLTQDLRSFWNSTYFEVRKELRRRYPKHCWPDNPLETEAVRGVKKRQ